MSLRGCSIPYYIFILSRDMHVNRDLIVLSLAESLPLQKRKTAILAIWLVNLSVQNSCRKYYVSSYLYFLLKLIIQRILTIDSSICYCCSSTRNMVLLCFQYKKMLLVTWMKEEVYSNKILRCINCRRKSRALGQARIQKGDLHSASKIWIWCNARKMHSLGVLIKMIRTPGNWPFLWWVFISRQLERKKRRSP